MSIRTPTLVRRRRRSRSLVDGAAGLIPGVTDGSALEVPAPRDRRRHSLYPHNHGLCTACALYGGREHNTFWRRTTHGLQKASGKEYGEGDVMIMGTDVVHSIQNPLSINNAALHVFAGNPFTTPHLQWDAETLQEAPFDNASMMQAYPSPA